MLGKQTAWTAIVMATIVWSGSARATVFFQDDFNDGVLDPTKWVPNPNANGGIVEEVGGFLHTVSAPGETSPYAQVRTSFDAMAANTTLTLSFNPFSVASSKNIGFWWGNAPDNPGDLNGFFVSFNGSQGSLNIHHVFGAHEESPGRWLHDSHNLSEGLYPGSLNQWHTWTIQKTLNLYTFLRDDVEILTYEPLIDEAPTALYWSEGYLWDFPRDGEVGDMRCDWIAITPEPSTMGILALGGIAYGNRRRSTR